MHIAVGRRDQLFEICSLPHQGSGNRKAWPGRSGLYARASTIDQLLELIGSFDMTLACFRRSDLKGDRIDPLLIPFQMAGKKGNYLLCAGHVPPSDPKGYKMPLSIKANQMKCPSPPKCSVVDLCPDPVRTGEPEAVRRLPDHIADGSGRQAPLRIVALSFESKSRSKV
jgi:hypothetical protein